MAPPAIILTGNQQRDFIESRQVAAMQNVRFRLFPSIYLLFLITFGGCQGLSIESKKGSIHRMPANRASCARLLRLLVDGESKEVSLREAISRSRPGQLGYGKPRVEYMIYRLKSWDLEKIQTYLQTRPVPYVIRPDGKWVISDRHHLMMALVASEEVLAERFPGKEIRLTYKLKADLSSATEVQYKQFMKKNQLINLRFKGEDIDWEEIPEDFNGLKKDFFRGMAWVLIKAKVIDKEMTSFAEFTWAELLRTRFPDLETVWDLETVELVMKDVLENPVVYGKLPGHKNLDASVPSLDEALENIKDISTALDW